MFIKEFLILILMIGLMGIVGGLEKAPSVETILISSNVRY